MCFLFYVLKDAECSETKNKQKKNAHAPVPPKKLLLFSICPLKRGGGVPVVYDYVRKKLSFSNAFSYGVTFWVIYHFTTLGITRKVALPLYNVEIHRFLE